MTPTLYKTRDLKHFIQAATSAIESFLVKQFEEKQFANVALSGGQSPAPVYSALSRSSVPWNRVNLFLVDERYVPQNSKESNTNMIQKTLIDEVKQVKNFYTYNTRKPIQEIVHQYQEMLEIRPKPLFDLVVLGLGEDGHTASLFPHDPALKETRRLVLHTQKPDPLNPQDRMTLTFPALLSSHKIIFLIQGKSKAKTVDRFVAGQASIDELPATGILTHPDIEVFYLEA